MLTKKLAQDKHNLHPKSSRQIIILVDIRELSSQSPLALRKDIKDSHGL